MDMREVAARVGVMRRSQLGVSRSELDRVLATGQISRLRKGWFARRDAHPDVARAVAMGGCLTCVSALALYGVWTPPTARLHVRYSMSRIQAGSKNAGCPVPQRTPVVGPVDEPRLAWRSAIRCVAWDEAVAITDSALRMGLISAEDVDSLPARRGIAVYVDPSAESGTESLVRVRLAKLGVRVRTQVQIRGVGRVDLLVGNRIIIECDSKAHHTAAAAYAKDRRRDRAAVVGKYIVVRLTWEDVMFGWDEVCPDIMSLIRADRHRSPRPVHIS